MKNIVYHGSSNGKINVLRSYVSTHGHNCIYATDSKIVAMMFMDKGNGDLDIVKGFDNGVFVLVERRPGILEKLYNKAGYIYELAGDTFKHYDYLWDSEVISFEKEIIPLKKECYDNVLVSLKKQANLGLLKLYEYPSRPDCIPFDNSDLIDKYIGFERQGIKGAINSLLEVYPEFRDRVMNKLNEMISCRDKIR